MRTLIVFTLLCGLALPAGTFADSPVRFFGNTGNRVLATVEFDAAVPHPDSVLGFPLGERPARHAQVLEYYRKLATATSRVKLFDMGKTYEGRPLMYAVITDEANMMRLQEIKSNLARLADPRSLPAAQAATIAAQTPACIWLAYSIHGDEISGVDAGIGVAYHLAAGMDSLTQAIRKNLVIIIDPIENPDGRERYLAQLEAFSSAVPHADGQSLQKGGFWPWGRGNHYLFDMNRDWFAQELAESKARVAAITEWHPQVFVDAHEMGQWDTYLFSPSRAPFNPFITDKQHWWARLFGADQAKAFDERGWPYYTREWNEEFYPGYGSSWPTYGGAVAILYEQAGVTGGIAQHDGTVLTYAEAVEHHYVSSLANVKTTLSHRTELLREYYDHRSRAVREFGGGKAKAYIVAPDGNPDRREHLAQTLNRQGIDVSVAQRSFSASARSYFDNRPTGKSFPAGSLVIPTNQPMGYLIQAILGFDLRIPDSSLAAERRELLKHRSSTLYEATGWSLLQAYGLDAYEAESVVSVMMERWKPATQSGSVSTGMASVGYIYDATTDRGLRATAMLMQKGIILHAAQKDLDVDGKKFGRGSVFIPKRSNNSTYVGTLQEVAASTGVTFTPLNSGMGVSGPDLGGRELGLLRSPRAALVAGGSTSFTSVGAIWHLLDQRIGLPVSIIDVGQLGGIDLSIYNVLIMPHGGGMSGVMGKSVAEKLKDWVAAGGTLIAMNASAAYCADSTVAISAARIRQHALPKLGDYERAAIDEIAAETPDISKLGVWEYSAKDTASKKESKTPSLDELNRMEELAVLFSPRGAILRVEMDQEHWLSFGVGKSVPAIMTTSTALLAKNPPVRTVGRFAAPQAIRLSGLLWPEARLRLAQSAYCTQERAGRGQVILFADQPNFRQFFRGAGRILSNAILFGPGLGTSWTPQW